MFQPNHGFKLSPPQLRADPFFRLGACSTWKLFVHGLNALPLLSSQLYTEYLESLFSVLEDSPCPVIR